MPELKQLPNVVCIHDIFLVLVNGESFPIKIPLWELLTILAVVRQRKWRNFHKRMLQLICVPRGVLQQCILRRASWLNCKSCREQDSLRNCATKAAKIALTVSNMATSVELSDRNGATALGMTLTQNLLPRQRFWPREVDWFSLLRMTWYQFWLKKPRLRFRAERNALTASAVRSVLSIYAPRKPTENNWRR